MAFAVIGTVVDSLEDWSLRVDLDCLLVISEDGKIAFRGKASKANVETVKER